MTPAGALALTGVVLAVAALTFGLTATFTERHSLAVLAGILFSFACACEIGAAWMQALA